MLAVRAAHRRQVRALEGHVGQHAGQFGYLGHDYCQRVAHLHRVAGVHQIVAGQTVVYPRPGVPGALFGQRLHQRRGIVVALGLQQGDAFHGDLSGGGGAHYALGRPLGDDAQPALGGGDGPLNTYLIVHLPLVPEDGPHLRRPVPSPVDGQYGHTRKYDAVRK